MRVTTQMVASNLMSNLDQLRSRLQQDQTDLATGVRIHVASDGPEAVAQAMQRKVSLRQLDSYDAAMSDSMGWLDTTDSSLNQIQKDLVRLRQLAVQAANDTNSPQSFTSLKTEMDAVYQDLLDLGNNQYNGKYIFAGAKVDVKPFVENGTGTAVVYNGDSQVLNREIGPGIRQAPNLAGSQLTAAVDFFTKIIQLRNDTAAGNSSAISANGLADLDKAIDSVSTNRALLGVRMEQVQTLQARNRDVRVTTQELLAKDIGADMEETAMHLALSQNSYQVALAVGAKIVPPTLVDFMR